ncbi:hypothetical protein [Streptomyces bambusae]|uniref:hypothetical protein n=1 Tax=Streptomyces bambusae TaxID=1550616 RepID=UPI002155C086|nr:hypothetical protein [Streptomyces bambusae]
MRIHYRLAGDDVAQFFALLRKVADRHQAAVPAARDAYLGLVLAEAARLLPEA